jgi:predicted DNA-binding transcriptional regulator AlpA
MSSEAFAPVSSVAPAASSRVSLSPYVNERFPNWEELLSAHDVARLTRRPRWLVLSLALLGRFPRKHRFHGHSVGWLRTDVQRWLSKDPKAIPCETQRARTPTSRTMRQAPLPFERAHLCAPRRVPVGCTLKRGGQQ